MLVLEPTKRYTIEQIKKHRWMAAEPYAVPLVIADPARSPAHAPAQAEPNEQLKIEQLRPPRGHLPSTPGSTESSRERRRPGRQETLETTLLHRRSRTR
ncbi:Serine/threonine-protein kinase SNF1-like kinase 2 [Operophtera brumata]|uniref:Serine/threonine-protein kinase SNF1-like kinase 2 n=1 Tax=Operophtera brumata TaxID=104452 RepID=A0A0L7KWI3_OPEBR|nr:Serine/threonine-protein kinase SNF1-like kinase 2 [Operophtera brumata]